MKPVPLTGKLLGLLICATAAGVVQALPPGVEWVYPLPNAAGVGLNSSISVDLESGQPPPEFCVDGSMSGRFTGSLLFDPVTNRHRFLPDRDYHVGEVVTVVLPNYDFNWSFSAEVLGGAGQFENPWLISTIQVNLGLAVFDAENDGDIDFAFTVPSSTTTRYLVIKLNQGSPSIWTTDYYTTAGLPYAVTAGDFTADGFLDLAIPLLQSNRLLISHNDGAGGFPTVYTYSNIVNDPYNLTTGDFDNDGDLDVVVANAGAANLSVALNTGTGVLGALGYYSSGTTPKGIFAGDFNEDGHLDLMVACQDDNQVRLQLGGGNGAFTSGIPISVGAEPLLLDCADFDQDGHLDVAVALYAGAGMAVLLGTGGGFAPPVTYATASGPVDVKAADYDGDGSIDLAVTCSFGNSVQVFLNDGTGVFVLRQSIPASGGPQLIDAGDLDNDGDLDLFVSNLGFNDNLIGIFWNELQTCCLARVGDANMLGGDEPTISDVSVMIDAKFITGNCDGIIVCLTEADINQTGGSDPTCDDVTISDISILIDYLFITGSSLGLPECL